MRLPMNMSGSITITLSNKLMSISSFTGLSVNNMNTMGIVNQGTMNITLSTTNHNRFTMMTTISSNHNLVTIITHLSLPSLLLITTILGMVTNSGSPITIHLSIILMNITHTITRTMIIQSIHWNIHIGQPLTKQFMNILWSTMI